MLDDSLHAELPADLTGPAVARRFVTENAGDIPDEVVQDAQLLVSELVTNAVRYGQPPISVSLLVDGAWLAVAVDDTGEALPEVTDPPPGPGASSGRGLLIVDTIAREWGVLEREQGKRVWFRVGGGS